MGCPVGSLSSEQHLDQRVSSRGRLVIGGGEDCSEVLRCRWCVFRVYGVRGDRRGEDHMHAGQGWI